MHHNGCGLVEQGKLLHMCQEIACHQERDLIIDRVPFHLDLRRRDLFLRFQVKHLV
jgi:hypothetical protein